ncbi:MAG: ABC transporter ATP-binding protein/permease [SAR86 cluster bacterium]|jgi:ATP-binding cassette subfamily B protein|nr:ABC transporter ATP-binding protein/permease [SAR86 cluster bacterium]
MLNPSVDDKGIVDLDAGLEPVNVEQRFANPKADIDRDQTKNWFRRVLPILLANRRSFGLGITLMVTTMMLGVSVPALIGKLVDSIEPTLSTGEISDFIFLVTIILIISLIRFIGGAIGSYQLGRVSNQLEADLRSVVYNHLFTLSFSFFDKTQTGQLISRANSDIKTIQMFLMIAPMLLTSLLSFAFAAIYMLSVHLTLALASMIAIPLVFFLSVKLRKLTFPLSWLTQARQADVAVIVDENINGQRIVKSFAQELMQVNLLARAAKKLQWVQVRSVDVSAFYNPLIENLTVLGSVLVWVYGGWLVIEGEIALGSLVAFTMYLMMIQMPFRFLGWMLMLEQRAKASAGRIFEILDETSEIKDKEDKVEMKEIKGSISFKNVSFAYANEPILKGLSFEVEPNETVAIVGQTGSGKSTIIRLLSRFYEVDKGSISIDGVKVQDMGVKNLHYHIAQVLDEPFLFSVSIKDNIAYGRPDASMDEIIQAAKAAEAHDFIEQTSEGYETVVGERGYTLSGGQRQRLGIARALLVDPSILILDDATSAIDVRIEAKIHKSLLKLLNKRTTILIAHRLSTISLADRILVLDKGKILASGTHEYLLTNEPRYSEILAQQSNKETVVEEEKTSDESDEEYRKRISEMVIKDTSEEGFKGGFDE